MSVVLMGIVDMGRRLDTYGGVGIFKIIFEIQVESACLAAFSLSSIDVTELLMMEQVVCSTLLLFFN